MSSEKVQNRNRTILDAAIQASAAKGFRNITRNDVAARAGVATGSVNNAYGTMDGLRDAVMSAAVEREMPDIVAQGLAEKHPAACNAPQPLKDSALASLAA